MTINKKIAILDYRTEAVIIRKIPENLQQLNRDEIWDYFVGKEKLDIDDCNYMIGDLEIINDD